MLGEPNDLDSVEVIDVDPREETGVGASVLAAMGLSWSCDAV